MFSVKKTSGRMVQPTAEIWKKLGSEKIATQMTGERTGNGQMSSADTVKQSKKYFERG